MRLISIRQWCLGRWRRKTATRRRQRYRVLLSIGVSTWVVVVLLILAGAAVGFLPSFKHHEVSRMFFGLVAFFTDLFVVWGLSVCERFCDVYEAR